MKVLFDPILTNEVSRCASMVKFKKLALHLLDKYPNCYIYWPVPSQEHWGDPDFLPKDERIQYRFIPFERDRYREYRRLHTHQEAMVAHYGDCWDWDLLVTNRTPMVPFYRQIALHHSSAKLMWPKQIMVLEDFPQMTFKVAASLPDIEAQDQQTLLGMAQADAVAISAYWEKALIIDKAKAWFAPSVIKKLRQSLQEATPMIVEETKLKSRAFVEGQIGQEKRRFDIVFAGRLVNGHRFDRIFKLMEQNFVLREGQVACHVCTQSLGGGRVEIPDWVKTHRFERQQFWDFMQSIAAVGVFFSAEEDYSMSLIEPMLLGVPYAVYKAPWSVASLGEDYPFFFSTYQECYQIVKDFYDDYATNYLRYAKWSKASFEPLLKSRNACSIFSVADKLIADQQQAFKGWCMASADGSDALNLMLKYVTEEPATPAVLMQRAIEAGEPVRNLAKKLSTSQMEFNLAFQTDLARMRLNLLKHGAQDCGVSPGLMKKVS